MRISSILHSISEHVHIKTASLPVVLGVVIVIVGAAVIGRDFVLNSRMAREQLASANSGINLLDGTWSYLPGAAARPGEVQSTYLGRTIVEKNNANRQLNPSVNTYGTHLKVSGNFAIHANMDAVKGSASLRLYDSVPVIQDEFRIEPKSVQLTLNQDKITVAVWSGYSGQKISAQQPSFRKDYEYGLQQSNAVVIERQDANVVVSINGMQIASVPGGDIFKSGNIWFGVDAENPGDSWRLTGLRATAVSNAAQAVDTSEAHSMPKDPAGLQMLATNKRPGFLIGAAMALGPAVSDEDYAKIAFGGNFGIMTTENALKWQFIHPAKDTYDFRDADALIAVASKNSLNVNGHTLVFGEANPKWVQDLPIATESDKQQVQKIMTDHITQTATHFRGKVTSWDVVNEPLADYDNFTPNGGELRQHKWFQAMGEAYIATAFRAAHAADPDAKLYLNEYGLEENGERWNALLALVGRLKAQNVPIDGVGFQAHVYEAADKIDPSVLREHIRALARFGLAARISEMDVYSADGTDVQAQQYADVLSVCVSEPNCVSWTTWGVTDRYNMWQDDNGVMQVGQDFLWNTQAQPTPAVARLRQVLQP